MVGAREKGAIEMNPASHRHGILARVRCEPAFGIELALAP